MIKLILPLLLILCVPSGCGNDSIKNGSQSNESLSLNNSDKKAKEWTDVKDGLVAHYEFNKNTHDSTGNSKKAEIIGGASAANDRHGNPQRCYDFNVAGYMILGNAEGIALKEFTTSVWFKWRSNHPDHIYRTLLAKGQGVYHTHMNYMLFVADTDQGDVSGKIGVVVGHGDEIAKSLRAATNFSGDKNVADNNWHHAVFTFSSERGAGNLYLDGKNVDSKNDVPPAFANKHQDATIGIWGGYERTSELFPQSGVNYGHWDGHIDDVRIYNRALSAEEVKALYDLEKPKGK
ncbi:MAG: LamG domain-containing protein [Verrucomicrobiota bacterium]|jgi:hypothetical protein|nr:LamG domain-containing protein [Verrucomicrobiota bacterium]